MREWCNGYRMTTSWYYEHGILSICLTPFSQIQPVYNAQQAWFIYALKSPRSSAPITPLIDAKRPATDRPDMITGLTGANWHLQQQP